MAAVLFPRVHAMHIEHTQFDHALVVAPQGRIDHTNGDAFRAALAPHVDSALAAARQIVIDLSQVDYISSAGLRAFMLVAKQVRGAGGTLVVAALQPIVREIFEISRFTLLFRTFASIEDALNALAGATAAETA
jgi:anti-sigma B factor antagonist